MPLVEFLPAGTRVEVPEGTLISEAAIRAGLTELHLPCGGKGTCGRCLVEIVRGPYAAPAHTHLDEALAAKNLALACRTKIRGDLVIRLRQGGEASLRVLGDSHVLVSEERLPAGEALSPLVRAEQHTVPPASIEEHYSDWQRLLRELARANGPVPVTTGLEVLRGLAAVLRADDGKVTVVLQETDHGLRVLEVQPGHQTWIGYGLAIDIGTTTVAVQLVCLSDGRIAASRTSYNAQIGRGADIISRIDYARTPERQEELRDLVLGTLNELIAGVASDAGVPAQAILAAFIAGNTTMIHLLLALPPRHIRETPYVPTVNQVPMLPAEAVGLAIHPEAPVACALGVGSYVGGDITAGILCTELPHRHDEVFLFLDIGTNGEIVLGNADWMVTCACSAGPAFEGSGIQCGMRAQEGAIEYVEVAPGGSDVHYDVIGGGKPAGICGSGLISLLGELFLRGVIDPSGRFNLELSTRRLVRQGNTRAFVLEWGSGTRDGRDLVITEADIENLMRTKAAIYAACSLILENVGLDWSGIDQVLIAGGFGRYIQVADAVLIGLLPDLPQDRFRYIGNSALTGAYIALLSRERRRELADIASKMTYVDLSSDPHYMDQYVAALFLPHTEAARFPSVAQRLVATAR